ncbi:MAG: VCBS repeat-containing protein, partial [Chloroflexi bacterium]|nr:VCBS repeat-containing protein [Chloroflexota bacterium]
MRSQPLNRWSVLLASIIVSLGLVGLFVLSLTPVAAATIPPQEEAAAGAAAGPGGVTALASVKHFQSPPPGSGSQGSNDFIISSDNGTDIYYFAIYGDGTIGPEVKIYTETSAIVYEGFLVGDFDRDGNNDFLSFDNSGTLYLFEQTAPAVFQRSTLLSSTGLLPGGGFVAADFNGDGYLDFAGRIGTKTGQVFLNQRDGTFQAGNTFSYNITVDNATAPQYGAGDIDSDGDIDLVLGRYPTNGSGSVYKLLNDGNGTLTFQSTAVATPPQAGQATFLGFFDGDGYLDIIAGQDDDNDPGQAWVYFGNGDGSFADDVDEEAYDTNPSTEGGNNEPGGGRARPFHINGDGFLDLVVVYRQAPLNPVSYSVSYWLGNGDGTFDKVEDFSTKTTDSRFSVPPILDIVVPYSQAWADECPFCARGEFTADGGDPVNTYSGNFNYQEVDFSIPILGMPLAFVRSYNSQATEVYTTPLGHGWTHNFNLHLIISDVVTA